MANAFDEVSANKFKSYLLMACFAAIIIALGYVFGNIYGDGNGGVIVTFMLLAFIISVAMALISYYWGADAALTMSNAHPADRRKHAHLINSVEGLAIAAGIPKPKIYVMPDQAINAFAAGRNPENAVIAVTEGALKKLNRVELEGVIAHEMGHIKNYDIRLMTVTVILVGLIAFLSDIFLRSMFFSGHSDDNRGGSHWIFLVLGIVLAILAPLIAELIKLAVSRRREFVADATGALLTRYPQGLADALRKIKKDHTPTKNANQATAHLFFSHPLEKKWSNNLFSTHPPIEERIKRLDAM